MVVVTVKTLGGHPIESYAQSLGNYWGIGRREINDGVVLLVAPNERMVRIAVGKGLEQTLADAEAKAIIERVVIPAFTHGDMQAGIDRGVDGIAREIGPTKRKAS